MEGYQFHFIDGIENFQYIGIFRNPVPYLVRCKTNQKKNWESMSIKVPMALLLGNCREVLNY